MKNIMLACAGAVLLAATSAVAGTFDGFGAVLDGNYTHFSAAGTDANSVGVAGTAAIPLNWNNFSAQINGDYHYLWGGGSINSGAFGGALVWNGMNGRFGLNGNYHTVSALSATTYGAGGEFYAAPDWTLGVRGGGISAAGGASGGYVGGEVIKYFGSNVSGTIGIDYTSLSGLHTTDYGVRLEYKAWEHLSVYGGYTFGDIPGLSVHALTIGLKWYCDGDDVDLAATQRSAPSQYISTYAATVFQF
jgi:hypothetical protein